jgi:hypothetical protein
VVVAGDGRVEGEVMADLVHQDADRRPVIAITLGAAAWAACPKGTAYQCHQGPTTEQRGEHAMDYDDPRWADLRGGYGLPYDAREALRRLEANINVEEAWDELCNELYHQGDVGEASYAAVPVLARIHAVRGVPDRNTYAVRGDGRRGAAERPQSAPAPWLEAAYHALRDLQAATDPTLVSYTIAAIAVGKGQPMLGRVAALFNEDERKDLLARWHK